MFIMFSAKSTKSKIPVEEGKKKKKLNQFQEDELIYLVKWEQMRWSEADWTPLICF